MLDSYKKEKYNKINDMIEKIKLSDIFTIYKTKNTMEFLKEDFIKKYNSHE